MARQIGKMLNAREPKIVNGPQILDKYVGESEANVRRLFAEAEEEEKRVNTSLLTVVYSNHNCKFSFSYSSWVPTVVCTSLFLTKSTPFASLVGQSPELQAFMILL